MSRFIACVLIGCCLLVTPGAFAEEAPKPAPEQSNGCGNLNININSTRGPAAVSSSGVACDRGYLSSIQPSQTETRLVVLQQSATYGPDCTITIRSGDRTAVIRAQQNYCALEAGNVNAFVVSGPAIVTRTERGSFAGGRPGQVWVTMN